MNIDIKRLRELAGLTESDDSKPKEMENLKICLDYLRQCKKELKEAGSKYPTGTMDDKMNRWADDVSRTVGAISRTIDEIQNYLNSWGGDQVDGAYEEL